MPIEVLLLDGVYVDRGVVVDRDKDEPVLSSHPTLREAIDASQGASGPEEGQS